MTVQVAVEELAMYCVPEIVGRVQVSPEVETGGVALTLAVCVIPPYDAVMVVD